MGSSKDSNKNSSKDKNGSALGNALNNVVSGVTEVAKDVGKAASDVAKDVGKAATNVAKDVGKATTDAAKGVANTAQDVAKGVSNATQTVVKGVSNTAQDVAQAVTGAAQEVADFVTEKFEKNTARLWFDEEIAQKGFPEAGFAHIKAKKDVGIAFSGGGIRSATAALGQTRALHELGLLPKVRYVACISGGSWFTVPWVYLPGNISDKEFLGNYTPPEKLSWNDLLEQYKNAGEASYMKIVEQAELVNKQALMQVFMPSVPLANSSKDETWGDLVAKNYLKPLKLYHKGAQRYATYTDAVRKTVLSRNETLDKNDFDCVEHDRPYMLVNGVAINWNLMGKFETALAEIFDKPEKPKDYPFYPFEFTPMYSGINTLYDAKETAGFFKFGGGYIENIAFDTQDPFGKLDGNFVKVKTKQQYNRLSLQDIMATSGAAPAFHALVAGTAAGTLAAGALAIGMGGAKMTLGAAAIKNLTGIFPRFFYWHLNKDKNVGNDNLYFGDGGFLDNYGLMPLLRRRVKNIILFINTDTPLNPHGVKDVTAQDIDKLKAGDNDNPLNKIEVDGALPALFGLHNSNASSSGFPHKWSGHQMQVFRKHAFADLITDLIDAKANTDGPVYAVATLEVLKNEFMGVPGGYSANVCFVMLQSCAKWEGALKGEFSERLIPPKTTAPDFTQTPADPLAMLFGRSGYSRKSHDASLAAFPNFATFGVHDKLEKNLTQGEKVAKYVDLQEMNREQAYLLSNYTDWLTREVAADKRVRAMFD